MKRTLCIILSLVMLLALCSCGKKQDSTARKDSENYYTLYKEAEEKTNALDAYSVTMTQISTVKTSEGAEIAVTAVTQRKANLSDTDNPSAYVNYDVNRDGEDRSVMSSYYTADMIYSDDGEAKTCEPTDALSVVSSFSNPAAFGLTENVFGSAEKSESDGKTQITAKPTDSSLDSFCSSFAQAFTGTGDAIFSDIKLNIVIEKAGYLEKLSLEFYSETDSLTAETKIEIEFAAIGEAPEITLPDDLDSYTEYSDDTADTSQDSSDTSADSEFISQEEGEAIDAAFALFDENYNKLPDYDEKYKEACDKYGKGTIDSIIEVIVALTAIQ